MEIPSGIFLLHLVLLLWRWIGAMGAPALLAAKSPTEHSTDRLGSP
jgi:hypothetical protein